MANIHLLVGKGMTNREGVIQMDIWIWVRYRRGCKRSCEIVLVKALRGRLKEEIKGDHSLKIIIFIRAQFRWAEKQCIKQEDCDLNIDLFSQFSVYAPPFFSDLPVQSRLSRTKQAFKISGANSPDLLRNNVSCLGA